MSSRGISCISVAVWWLERKCSETAVGLEMLVCLFIYTYAFLDVIGNVVVKCFVEFGVVRLPHTHDPYYEPLLIQRQTLFTGARYCHGN